MKRACFKFVVTLLPLLGALAAPASACLAWGESMAGYDCCRRCSQFRLVDGCTRCAWRRTWWGPNPLATPLREYYIPRPPQCCIYGGFLDGCGYGVGESYASCNGKRYDEAAVTAGDIYKPELGAP